MLTFRIAEVSTDLTCGLNELQKMYGYRIMEEQGIRLKATQKDGAPIVVSFSGQTAVISYDKKIHFFRGLGLLLEQLQKGSGSFELTETPQFEMNGAMFDVSQGNAVLKPCAVKNILKRMAVMGLNMLMLYCEDSFTVESEPYFGYMRSRYTEEELRDCDSYADLFGIEMIPCIQTLAHFIDVLKWHVFDEIKEDGETLLVGCDKTYEFIDHLIEAVSRSFKTKKIHIGMDEAWRLGLGTYLSQHGLVPKSDIMKEHLSRVMVLVRKHGLEPMMWSDMFFRAFTDKGYYDESVNIPKDIAQSMVPEEMSLVYWDYYSVEEDHYDSFFKKHDVFERPTIFAGGIWTWTGFGANWGLTFDTTHPALMSCKKNGIKQVFATIWGDNGTECNAYANLLGLSLFAEHGYSYEFEEQKFKERFAFCTGCHYDDFNAIRFLDEVPGCEQNNREQINASKYLMWQDVLSGLFDRNIRGLPLNDHYQKLAGQFLTASARNGEYDSLFEYCYHVANVLALKSEIGVNLKQAYDDNNKAALKEYAETTIPEIKRRTEALRKCHKRNWFAMNHALGWDVMDMRYGSLLIRLDSAAEQILAYLSGELETLEELDEARLAYHGADGLVGYANFYGKIVSASRIAPEA